MHCDTRVIGGLRREWSRDSAQDQIVRRGESTVVDEQIAKTRVLSRVGQATDNPQRKHHDRADGPERVVDTGAETREQKVDEKMCAPVEEIGEEARRATPMYVPRGLSDAERRAHEIHHMPCRFWCVASEDEEKKVFTLVEKSRATMVSQSCKWTARSSTILELRMQRSRSS